MNHLLLEREIDPIDDVRRQFENVYTEDYYNPTNGDWISDDYLQIINLSTQPAKLNADDFAKLDRTIERLNGKYDFIQNRLGEASLRDAYNSVAEQVNAINEANPDREGIARMYSAPPEQAD